jgi:hypothetical protein
MVQLDADFMNEILDEMQADIDAQKAETSEPVTQ